MLHSVETASRISFQFQDARRKASDVGRKVAAATIDMLAIHGQLPPKYPFRMPLGGIGAGGIHILMRVNNHTDLDRVLTLMGERPFLRAFGKIINRLPEGSGVWDVGAAEGAYAMVAGRKTAKRNIDVYAFDADPNMVDGLTLNLLDHDFPVNIVPYLLGNEERTATLFYSNDVRKAASLTPDPERPLSIDVPMKTIDGLVAERKTPPTVIKLDVEGAEGLILEGAKQTLTDGLIRHLFLELHSDYMLEAASNTTQREVLSFLGEHNMKVQRKFNLHGGDTRHLHLVRAA